MENIYKKVKNMIVSGVLNPGEKLYEVELAKTLNVSRTPVREAFRQLQMEGYITVFPNKGAFVSKLPPEEINETYSVIILTEGFAAGLAAQNISKPELNELKKIQKKLISYVSEKKYRDYAEKNTDFHYLITHSSGNKMLTKFTNKLRSHVYRYRLTSVTVPGYLEQYVSHHEKIIDAISKKNATAAKNYMEEHVTFVKTVLVNFLQENPNY